MAKLVLQTLGMTEAIYYQLTAVPTDLHCVLLTTANLSKVKLVY